jgi:hypothetical protein
MNIIYHINILTLMIISFLNIKYANNEWHKNLTNVNVCIFLKIEGCEGGRLICRVVFYSSKYGILVIFEMRNI